jgi:hypothetical protein
MASTPNLQTPCQLPSRYQYQHTTVTTININDDMNTSQKTAFFIVTAMKTSNLTSINRQGSVAET